MLLHDFPEFLSNYHFSLCDVIPSSIDALLNFTEAFKLVSSKAIEIWQKAADMPVGLMLQIVVDDADAVAATARQNGIDVQGPMEAHGEKIYFAIAPGGLSVSFQQVLEERAGDN